MATNPFGSRGRAGLAPYLGLMPGLGVFAVFMLLPAIAVGYFALTDATGVTGIPIHFVGLDNFKEFFTGANSTENRAVIVRSVVYAAAVTVVQNVLALGIALVLNGRIRGRTVFRVIIFAPVVLGATVTGLVWELVMNPSEGPAAGVLSLFGSASSFFGSDSIAFYLVIGVQVWVGLGYSMVIFLGGLQTIPPELYESATVDGAGAWRQFTAVTWPLLAPSVTANVLISIIGSLQSYQLVYVLTGGQHDTSVLGYEVFAKAFSTQGGTGTLTQTFSQQGYASAISIVQFVVTVVMALLVLSFLRRREVQL